MFIFGDAYYGRVDRVAGLFLVKTRFLHVWWIPFVPRESWVVVDDGRGEHGQRIPLSWRSVLVTWSRVAIGFFFVFMVMTLFLLSQTNPKNVRVHPIVSAAFVTALIALLAGAYALTYRWARPSADRAFQLAAWLGVDPAEVADRLPLSEHPVRPVLAESVTAGWRYDLVVLNDDTHTYDYVVGLLREVFGVSETKALALALAIDRTGRVVVFTGSLDDVNAKREQILARGRDPSLPRSDGPLRVEILEAG